MSDNAPFRTVLRGYDPAEVDARLRALSQQAGSAQATSDELTKARAQAQQLAEQVRALQTQIAEPTVRPSRTPTAAPVQASFTDLGARIGQMLSLAEEEATELRDQARADADAHRQGVHDAVAKVQQEAEPTRQPSGAAPPTPRSPGCWRTPSAGPTRCSTTPTGTPARAARRPRRSTRTSARRPRRPRPTSRPPWPSAASAPRRTSWSAAPRPRPSSRPCRSAPRRCARSSSGSSATRPRRSRTSWRRRAQKAAEIVSAAQTRAERVRAESERELAAADPAPRQHQRPAHQRPADAGDAVRHGAGGHRCRPMTSRRTTGARRPRRVVPLPPAPWSRTASRST